MIHVDVTVRDNHKHFAKKKYKAIYDAFGRVGYFTMKNTKQRIGHPVRRKNIKPRPVGKPPRARQAGHMLHIEFHPNDNRTEMYVGTVRYRNIKQQGSYVGPGLHERSGPARIKVFQDAQPRKRKSRAKAKRNLTDAQREKLKRMARQANALRKQQRSANMRWVPIFVPKRPFIKPQFERVLKRLPSLMRKEFRRA